MSTPALDPTLVRRYDREGGRHAHDHAQVLFGISGTLQLEGHDELVPPILRREPAAPAEALPKEAAHV